ncbi:MAG: FixH family protein [Blastocatellia bacterium]|nr:FixH family protein [Blastocatellia bacterium]
MSYLRRGRLLACLVLAGGIIALAGCRKTAPSGPDIVMWHDIAPSPPKVGAATITVGLTDTAGKPIVGARINLEGNMTHPGMRPVFGEAGEIGAGRYQAPLRFTMGGDWIILVRINLLNGQKLEREFEVKGVRSS